MKYHLTIAFLFFCCSLFAQEASPQPPPKEGEKGVSPIKSPPPTGGGRGEAYAVVVGISDYQDEGIPDLQYAHKDAEAFANFLRSPAGGGLDKDHLKVLINKKATAAQFAIALDWLWEVVQENDRVIIYFSGHGDVERKSITQPGYLLCWDAPSQVYLAGGAMNVRDLNDVVSTLSIQNKAKVILVTDACRAGKLSGSGIGGSQATAANLAKQYANEIKILSCQPDEYSIEGEQWGGGRGAFSYHLLDGLSGMADGNADNTVNLKEIGRYLEDYVTEEVAPQKQNPMVLGDKAEKLADVFPEILAQLKEGKKGQMQLFTATESRGIEEEVLAAADSNIVELYLAFQEAIEVKQFLTPENASAEFYFGKLSHEPQLERMHSSMRRNYAAALQDDAQQVLNKLLKSDPAENQKTLISINAQYGKYPENLRRAAELLGSEHYMYNELMARSFWFEGYLIDASRCACLNHQNADKVIPFYKKALEYQPEMPHAWVQLAALYGLQKHELDTAEYYADLAIKAVPEWVLVYHWIGNAYLNYADTYGTKDKEAALKKAQKWLNMGMAIDSNSVLLLNELAYLYNINGAYEKEQEMLDRSFKLEPLAQTMFFKGQGYMSWKKWDEAEKAFLHAIKLDSSLISQPNGILFLYEKTGQVKKFFEMYKKAIAYSEVTWNVGWHDTYWSALKKMEDKAELLLFLEQAAAKYPDNAGLNWTLGTFYLHVDKDDKKADESYEKVLYLDSSTTTYDKIVLHFLMANSLELANKYGERALEKYPENQWMLSNSITPYIRLAYFEKGIKAAERSLAVYPNDQFSLICSGVLMYEKGDYSAAEEFYKLAMKGSERRIARAQLYLGILYQKTGRHSEAEKTFKEALEFGKGDNPIDWNSSVMMIPRFRQEWKEILQLLAGWYPDRDDIQRELSELERIEADND